MTKGEASLWKFMLSRRQVRGYQFLRQRPVLNYIADFMCKELMLIIEVDGITHDDKEARARDKIRQQKLESIGFTVLRFSDFEVLERMPDVGVMLGKWLDEHNFLKVEEVHPPDPLQRGTNSPYQEHCGMKRRKNCTNPQN
jgi:very-short-patch-repair endonuclease